MKILILRFSSIGDIVLTTPVVRCLRKKYPDAQIHYATKKSFQGILKSNPYINKIHLLQHSVWDLISALKQEKFDYIIDLHHNQRTLLIKTLLGVKSFSFNKLNFEKWLLVNFKINRLPPKHIVDRYLDACHPLGVENDGEGLDYFIDAADEVNTTELSGLNGAPYIAWVIGAKQNTKKFPVKKIIAALQSGNAPNYPVVLLGGKEDEAEGCQIFEACKGNMQLIDASGRFSLNQSASLVKQAAVVVTNDTGLMHMAAAFKRPVVSLWGNTVPAFGMYPYYGNFKVESLKFEVENLPCRPCSKLGYSQCPKGHFKCMNLIDEIEVAHKLRQLLSVERI